MTELQKITIGIAEDHELFRKSLEIALSQNPNLEVLWSCADANQFKILFEKQKPNLILIDIGLPFISGIDLTKTIKQSNNDIKVVMLTAHNENDIVLKALQAGADAYCTKEISFEKLNDVLKTVMDGAIWLDPAIANYLYGYVKELQPQAIDQSYNFNLSSRELEVLELMMQGLSNKEIAQKLFITVHTVKAHVCNTIQKLSAKDRTDAAVKAAKYNIFGS